MMQEVDVVVVGGGVVGLSAAIAMRQRHFSVAILDATTFELDMNKQDLRVYAINRASQDLLQQLQVWPKLDKARLSPYTKMHVWDAQSMGQIDFDARLMHTDRLGTIVQESVLKHALLQQAKDLGVLFFPNSGVFAIDLSLPHIIVGSDTKKWQAKLMIVADGALSKARSLLNIPITTWPYHQAAIIAEVKTEKSHLQTAFQVFHPNGPLAFLPLANPHQSSIVWSTSLTHANQLMALSDDLFQQKLTEAFAKKLGSVTVSSKRRHFPLSMRHVSTYSGPNWLLMGDAAHTIHPMAGLGLNIGLADLANWLLLFDASPIIGSKKMMGAYQRQRKNEVWQYIVLMEGLKTIFSNPWSPISLLRGFGLNRCNDSSLIKRVFIKHAAG